MKSWLKRWLFQQEMQEIERWRTTWWLYDRYLAEFPDISGVLTSFKAQVDGKEMNCTHPPSEAGPWVIENLRWHIRRNRAPALSHKTPEAK